MTEAVTLADAQRVARALVGEDPTPEEAARWQRAVDRRARPLVTPVDRALWAWARRGEPWLGWVDAGLALSEPYSPVRHRIYLMLAVLEASPAHIDRFEAKAVSPPTALAELGIRATIGAVRSIVGVAFVLGVRVLRR